jgi:tubulin alpha
LGGGTGSGLGSLLLENLSGDYEKKIKMGFNIFPSPQLSSACVEPYNAMLAASSLIEHQNVSVVLEN